MECVKKLPEEFYLVCPDNRKQVDRSKITWYYANMNTLDTKKTLASSL